MKDLKTTLAGILSAGAYGALSYFQSGGVNWKDAAVMAGLSALGYLAKDGGKNAGSVQEKG